MVIDSNAKILLIADIMVRYLASSNLSDIRAYCEKYEITYLTTMDFLAEAFRINLLTETECNEFIRTVKNSGSKLIKNINRIRDYQTR